MKRWIAALAMGIASGCSSPSKAPEPQSVPPPPPDWVWEADPNLIAEGVTSRVDIEVDWVAGLEPDEIAMEALAVIAKRECPGKLVTIRRDTEIPVSRWKEARGDAVEDLLADVCGPKALREGVAFVHIVYCPVAPWKEERSLNGLCRAVDRPFPHSQIFMFKAVLNSRSFLGLTPGKLDRSCLIHEFGHALGLVANPEHRFEDGGGHCTNTKCVMTKPKGKAIVENAADVLATGEIPWDYCAQCVADLQRSREAWREKRRGR